MTVIAFAHDGIHGRGLASDIWISRDGPSNQRLPANADGERIGQKHGSLELAELFQLHEPDALAEAVEHMSGGDDLVAKQVAFMRQDGRDAGARVFREECAVPDHNARHIRDGVAGAGGQSAAGEPKITGPHQRNF